MQPLKPHCYQECFLTLKDEQIDYNNNKYDPYALQHFEY